MKKLILLILFANFFSKESLGQPHSQSIRILDFPQRDLISMPDFIDEQLAASQNRTSGNQLYLYVDGAESRGQAVQMGRDNHLILLQKGQNTHSKVSQIGQNNSYEVRIEGNNSQHQVLQEGTDNRLQQIEPKDSQRTEIRQFGNELTVVNDWRSPVKGYRISQKGQKMKLIVELRKC